MLSQRDRFLEYAQRNSVNCALLGQAARLDVPDWWLTAGAVFQTVWNVIDGRDPTAGIGDYDLFYFDDTDLSWDAEDAVIHRAAELFAGIQGVVEVRNEARVHLWYEQHFGVPAEPFTSTVDAVDHFASTTCGSPSPKTPAGAYRCMHPTATTICLPNVCVRTHGWPHARSTNAKLRAGPPSGPV